MVFFGMFHLCLLALLGRVSTQDYFLAKNSSNIVASEPFDNVAANISENGSSYDAPSPSVQDWRGVRYNDHMPCDVNEIFNRGDTASYYIFQKYHGEYMSTNGRNVDLYHDSGSHAVWHLKQVEGHTANRFYIVNDWQNKYLQSSGNWNYDNVELASWSWTDRDLQWLFFSAPEITNGAPKCSFYIMHSDSHKWLDTHGHNVHIWGDSSDIFDVADAPENLQWELRPVLPRK